MSITWGGPTRPHTLRSRIIAAVVTTIALVILLLTHQPGNTRMPLEPGHTTTTLCYEDEPCWDCETMGNRLCGPITQD